ncbi:GNAT family N-acetyltransferase [Streptomyces canus]|uniref:GNAT family N-acetyltransferase n=1 Tax=Streptomyces canus TaxID=58343 RepID=UPI0022593CA8|nr:GNAT family N-acetyltransferase [Streptomyces canus]MCX5257520.1 GNAT family N-acetyltransferase [Streptomyces canus]
MDHVAVLALFDRDMREGAQPDGPGARVERVGGVVRQVAAEHGWNGVVWSDLDASSADKAIAEQIAYYTGLGREFEWKLYGHDLPFDLGQRLRAAGFTAEPEETLMIAEVADLTLDVEPPEGIRFLPVTDRAGVDLVAEVHEKAFGTDSSRLRHQLLARLDDPDTVVAVVALAGDVPVSAARMELVPGTRFAGLWGGGTVESWRGRGIYRALVAHRARAAVERGYRYLQVDAMATSRPILERLGFEPLTITQPHVYQP